MGEYGGTYADRCQVRGCARPYARPCEQCVRMICEDHASWQTWPQQPWCMDCLTRRSMCSVVGCTEMAEGQCARCNAKLCPKHGQARGRLRSWGPLCEECRTRQTNKRPPTVAPTRVLPSTHYWSEAVSLVAGLAIIILVLFGAGWCVKAVIDYDPSDSGRSRGFPESGSPADVWCDTFPGPGVVTLANGKSYDEECLDNYSWTK